MARAAEGDVLAEPPVVVAENTPALVVPTGNPAGITGLDAGLDGADLVVCAPQVPCGAAAAGLAEEAGVELTPVSEELSVNDVLGKVMSGQADAGIVYATDARRAGGSVEVVEVPGATNVVNRYLAAVVTGGETALAGLWMDTLTGAAGRDRLAAAGFGTP
jgi:molybdate transport system substrate-binding protein